MTGPELKGCRCQCAACDEYFGSERAFDRHRVGPYAEPGEWVGNRRCLTSEELDASGWPTNPRGFRLQPRPERAPAEVSGPCMTPLATGVAGGEP